MTAPQNSNDRPPRVTREGLILTGTMLTFGLTILATIAAALYGLAKIVGIV